MATTARQTAIRDQYDAATADAARRLAAVLARPGARIVPGAAVWVTDQFAAIRDALNAGTARLCPHITTSPAVVHAAVWDRWHLACSLCIRALQPAPGDESVCDRCHRDVGMVHPGVVNTGPVLLMFGLCSPCVTDTRSLSRRGPRAGRAG